MLLLVDRYKRSKCCDGTGMPKPDDYIDQRLIELPFPRMQEYNRFATLVVKYFSTGVIDSDKEQVRADVKSIANHIAEQFMAQTPFAKFNRDYRLRVAQVIIEVVD